MLQKLGLLILKSLLQFLGRELIDLLNDKRLQRLAIKAVENASNLDLDGDGKRQHAANCLKAEAASIGRDLKDRYANMLVEAAVNKVKGKL